MSEIDRAVGKHDGRSSFRRYDGDGRLREWCRVWCSVGLRTQAAVALDDGPSGMDIGDLLSHRRQDDLGAHPCSDLCLSDSLRLFRDESLLSCPSRGGFLLAAMMNWRWTPFLNRWQWTGSAGVFDLSY